MNLNAKRLTAVFLIISFITNTSVVISDDKTSNHALIAQCPISDGFDFPVGKPNAKGYYNAQKFGKIFHLGEDWNGTSGGNSDLGDAVYAISNGIVVASENLRGGWGNVIRIVHCVENKRVEGSKSKNNIQLLESIYAHLNEAQVEVGNKVKKGEKIATIGNVEGLYLAHLHLELRDQINLPIGRGYSKVTKGYLNPTEFIKQNRSF